MDGAYITARNKEDIENLVVRIFRSLSEVFLNEQNHRFLYLVRGSIAFGEVIHGHSVPYNASKALEMSLGYKDSILLGRAMMLAFDGESRASPFGLYIDDSAIKHDDGRGGSFSREWKWYNSKALKVEANISQRLSRKISQHLEELKDENHPLHYPIDRIEEHLSKTMDYYG